MWCVCWLVNGPSFFSQVRDQMDMAEELSNAIAQPMGNALFDDDELEAELKALEDEDIDQKLAKLDLPQVPDRQHDKPVVAAVAAPPANAGKSKIDLELAELEAEMGM
jgi:charged multivesicular body protein 4